jgi:tRNA G46 methylase TrmB
MTDLTSSDALMSPLFLRNRDPILAVLTRVLPDRGTVLEIASGSGEHAIAFAAALPSLIWQPTDLDPVALRSIAAHRAAARLPNVRPPLQLDAAAASWPVVDAGAVVAINMLHIAPWRAAEGLMAGAGRVLGPGGVPLPIRSLQGDRSMTAFT